MNAISPYSITFVGAFIVSIAVVFLLLKKRGVPTNYIGYSVLLNVVLILYGGKMFTVVTRGFQISIFTAGFSSLGGAIGLLVGIFVFGKIYPEGSTSLWEAYVTVLPLLYGISKIGCYLVGCCHGISYEGPLAVVYDSDYMQGGPYFPVQLAESIGFLGIFVVGLLIYLRSNRRNLVPVIMILCATTKFSLDFLREEHLGKIVSANQLVCIVFFFWGVITLIKNKNKIHAV
ncbi:MAG: prolipoprotein diacylglyceryl transferase [Lachnospiraceae bacterium]|nr:prolipoprotein diacylglyceryl transferase [Lachnospiraceae bacterium]